MNTLSPKPIIARVHRRWHVAPGLTFALVEDIEHNHWVVESCPAGTHVWNLEQASKLATGGRTRRVLDLALNAGRLLEKSKTPVRLPRVVERAMPAPDRAEDQRVRSRRTASGSASEARDRARSGARELVTA